MPLVTNTKQSFWVRNRYWIILGSILTFLPPLSFLFQFTQDSNFCGTWCPRMFFVIRSGMSGKEFAIGLLRSYAGVGLVLGILISTFFLGRYWCSHLCPVGGTMEWVSRIVPKSWKINYSTVPAPSFRYGYLTVYLLAPIFGIGNLCCNYCNFATIPRLAGAAFTQADLAYFMRTAGLINLGLVVVLGFLARGGRAYCNLLCPIGALDALSGKLGAKSGKRVRVRENACTGCKACLKVCPTWSIDMKENRAQIDQLSCLPCRICEKTCPREAITYGKAEN
ncbi:MAG: 4Fe-4S binding protein [Candidatus Schekmanbacteria bacterium]|nr:4Fe-4S binding protein [Candidatus Schekmanbacteria bacterium]